MISSRGEVHSTILKFTKSENELYFFMRTKEHYFFDEAILFSSYIYDQMQNIEI